MFAANESLLNISIIFIFCSRINLGEGAKKYTTIDIINYKKWPIE